jgi:hypothetical protein
METFEALTDTHAFWSGSDVTAAKRWHNSRSVCSPPEAPGTFDHDLIMSERDEITKFSGSGGNCLSSS